MDIFEYVQLKSEYIRYGDEKFRAFIWQHAFEEFDAQVECYCGNGYERNNDGLSILDVTPEEVERILALYIVRFYDDGSSIRDKWMRDAIQSVTGLVC